MNNDRTDSLFQSYRDDLIAIIKRIMDTGDFFDSAEYKIKTTKNSLFFHRAFDHTEHFLGTVKGISEGPTAGF